MKTLTHLLLLSLLLCSVSTQAQTWSEWFKQSKTQKKYLYLQIAKLFIHNDLVKKGFDIAGGGLTTVGGDKGEEVTTHRGHFDALKLISPPIADYAKVAAILVMQKQFLTAYQKLRSLLSQASLLPASYTDNCFKQLSEMLSLLDEEMDLLENVLRKGSLQMTDHERIACIDRIYENITRKKQWINQFTNNINTLILQLHKEKKSYQTIQQLN